MNILYLMLGLAILLGGGFVAYDYLVLQKARKVNGLRVRILLYEQIGDDKVFRGTFKGVERKDDKLGSYIWIKKFKKAIDIPANRDYFYDKELDKALNVCKYADDDYRVMARLRNGEFYRLENVKKPKVDADGKPVYDEVDNDDGSVTKVQVFEDAQELNPYTEPLGIVQEGREASRFNRTFTKRMQEKRGEKAGFWDKYGQIIGVFFVGALLLIGFVHMSNTFKSANEKNAELWGEKLAEAVEATSNPSWVANLVDELNKNRLEQNAPDS